jgi:5'-phosphate synthase pdxT subunit
MVRYGVLALQGDFAEHAHILRRIGVDAVEVRLPDHLRDLSGLVIPGGESTTIGKLAVAYHLIEPIRDMVQRGLPVWGTCAGMILLAKSAGRDQPLLGMMDIQVKRNAFGRQLDSFEIDLPVPALDAVGSAEEHGKPFHAVFIRAPYIERVGAPVETLATLDNGTIVAARQGNLLVTAFHPELGDDTRFHRYFLTIGRP